MKKGQRMSDEQRAKISAKMKGVFKTEAARLKISDAKTGVKRNYRSDEWRENLSKSLKGKKRHPLSAETKAKLSAWMKSRWDFVKQQEAALNERGPQAEADPQGRTGSEGN